MSTTTNSLSSKVKQTETVEKIPQPKGKKGISAKEIVNRHISNKNDVITDEEFKNLDVSVNEITQDMKTPIIISDNSERPKDEDKDPKIATSWDVIS